MSIAATLTGVLLGLVVASVTRSPIWALTLIVLAAVPLSILARFYGL